MALTPEQELKIRRKLKDSFEYYAPRCLKIRPKKGPLKEFTLNKAQMYLHMRAEKQMKDTGMIRILVLKGRQQGMCLSPDTLVMRNDFSWAKIKTIKVGDKLVGIDENSVGKTKSGRRSTRKMRTASVQAVRSFRRELFEISLSDGRVLKCTAEHRWAMRQRGGDYVQWRAVSDAKPGDFIRAATYAPDTHIPTFDDGWAAGALDADGSCAKTGVPRVAFSQIAGLVLDRYRSYLAGIGVGWYEQVDTRTKVGRTAKLGDKPVYTVRVDTMPDMMRLLGRAKTTRFDTELIYKGRKLPKSTNSFKAWVEITSIRSLGVSKVVDIQTDCKTFIAEGMVSHNSTYIEGRFYWKVTHRKGVKAFILTHEDRATKNLFAMAERFHQHCPEKMKPTTGASSSKELSFSKLDSGYAVGTAGTKGVGRSDTLQYFHGSESAHWPHADTHAMGVMQAVPLVPGTEIFLESTANGIGNYFHAQYQLAEAGLSSYIAVFLPWYWQDEYTLPITNEFRLDVNEDNDEVALLKQFGPDGLTKEHLAWRRMKVIEFATKGSGDDGGWRFKQEYPMTAAEAFQTSGEDGLIDPKVVLAARKRTVASSPTAAKVVGVDPARFGKDRTSIAYRQGRRVWRLDSYRKKSTMEVAGICGKILRNPVTQEDTDIDMMFIDVGGLGAGVVDRLVELGFEDRITAVNSSEKPIETERFYNKRMEMWGEMNDWLHMRVDIPDTDSLQADLCGPMYSYDSASRMVLERKEHMIARGIISPDEAEAIGLTFAYPCAKGGQQRPRVVVPAIIDSGVGY